MAQQQTRRFTIPHAPFASVEAKPIIALIKLLVQVNVRSSLMLSPVILMKYHPMYRAHDERTATLERLMYGKH